jgi:hypothetical protein
MRHCLLTMVKKVLHRYDGLAQQRRRRFRGGVRVGARGRAAGADHDAAHTRQPGGERREAVGVAGVDDQGGGVGAGEDVSQQLAAVVGVDRHGDGAEPGEGEDDVHQLRGVGEHHRDVVALADALRDQPLRDAVGHRVDFAVRDLAVVELQEGLVSVTLGPGGEDLADDETLQPLAAHPHLRWRRSVPTAHAVRRWRGHLAPYEHVSRMRHKVAGSGSPRFQRVNGHKCDHSRIDFGRCRAARPTWCQLP